MATHRKPRSNEKKLRKREEKIKAMDARRSNQQNDEEGDNDRSENNSNAAPLLHHHRQLQQRSSPTSSPALRGGSSSKHSSPSLSYAPPTSNNHSNNTNNHNQRRSQSSSSVKSFGVPPTPPLGPSVATSMKQQQQQHNSGHGNTKSAHKHSNNSNSNNTPPIGSLLKNLPTEELKELEIAVRSLLYVLCDNLCPIVKALNEKRRQCVKDVRDMLSSNNAVGELYGSGRTGLTACTSSDLDFVAVVDGTPCSPAPTDPKLNNGMSGFYRKPTVMSPTTASVQKLIGKKRSRDEGGGDDAVDEESLFFEETFDSEDDDDGSLRAMTSPTSMNPFAMTRSQRRREMGPLVRQLISQAAQFRRGGASSSPPNTNSNLSRHQQQTVNRHQQRYGNVGPPVFVGFKPIINAKVPLLKCTHRATQLEIDLSFALDGAKSSDYLISRLSSQNPPCLVAARGLIVLLKHLLHEADLNDPSVGGLGSFPLCLMVVWFLESEVHRNFPIELQGSYAVLLTRFFAYYGDTFDVKHYGIDCLAKEMFSKAASSVLIIKNPLDRNLNAASACSKYMSDVKPLFQRLNKAFMQAMTPRGASNNTSTSPNANNSPSPAVIAERLFKKVIAQESHRRCYEAFAATLKKLAAEAPDHPTNIEFTPTFLKSVLAPVTTRWGEEMVCEMEGIGLGTHW